MADATGTGPYRTSRVGFFFIVLSALLFGSLGVTTKGVLNVATTNAFSITLLRAIIALPTLLAISAVILGGNMFRIAVSDLRIMVFAGLMMVLYQVTFVIAITLVNVTIATLVTLCTVPVFAALLSRILLGERLQSSIVVALVCAIAGVALLVGVQPLADTGANTWLGISLALLAALGFGLFQICGRVLANRYHPTQTLSVFFFVAAVALLPIAFVNGFVTDYPLVGWLLLAHLGLGISVVGYAFMVLGLRTTPVTMAALISLLEPLTGTILAWLLFNERLGALGLLGAALLLSAMVMVFRTSTTATTEVAERQGYRVDSGSYWESRFKD